MEAVGPPCPVTVPSLLVSGPFLFLPCLASHIRFLSLAGSSDQSWGVFLLPQDLSFRDLLELPQLLGPLSLPHSTPKSRS